MEESVRQAWFGGGVVPRKGWYTTVDVTATCKGGPARTLTVEVVPDDGQPVEQVSKSLPTESYGDGAWRSVIHVHWLCVPASWSYRSAVREKDGRVVVDAVEHRVVTAGKDCKY
ncbi:hypothetical protein FB465_0049 [Kitasatospora atroaurantiaca]|uniref:Uncharacterized protein n=1 Tax=Kitasatospora atroaurantiaca TaxID=285545 RepID=A0A561EHT2_9ACTN|nr:hypothetical protein FB465_0049 [Kitasatospora atroaurantiaca]